jgi:hypothetical protein
MLPNRVHLVAMLALMMSPRMSAAPVPVVAPTHDEKVVSVVKTYLAKSFEKPGTIAIATRVQLALADATEGRTKGGTTDIVLRDAEYYLHGLYATAANDVQHAIPVVGAPVYDVLKWAAFELKGKGYDGLEKWMRTDPDKPISEPGGWRWAYKGLVAGAKLNGKKEVSAGAPPTETLPR